MHDLTARRFAATRISGPWRSLLIRFTAGFLTVVFLVTVAWPFLPRRYEAAATIILRPTEQDGGNEGSPPLRQMLDDGAIQSEIDRISAPELAARVIARHDLGNDPEFAKSSLFSLQHIQAADLPRVLSDHLSVSRDKRSYTLKLGYWARDPIKATAMTKTLVEVYLEDQLVRKRKALEDLTQWLGNRANSLRAKHETSEKAANDFLVNSGLIDSGALASLESQLATFSTELAQARTRLIEATTRLRTLKELHAAGSLDNAPDVLASPSIRHLKEALAAARSKTAVLDSETHAIQAEIAAESILVLRGTESDIRSWTDRWSLLRDEIATIRSAIIKRRQDEMRLMELQREATSDKAVLDDALTRFKNQVGRADGVRPDAEVITTAQRPTAAKFPNPILAALGTLLAAGLAGVVTAWRPLTRLLGQRVVV